MGSPITFSGFNQIDFNTILNAIMAQESQPLTALQTRQNELQATDSAYAQLATKLGSLKNATSSLTASTSFQDSSATSSNESAVGASAGAGAVAGRYDVVVNELARGQVTVSSSTSADTDATVVADGGTLTIGSTVITVNGPVTLGELASQINADTSSPATASIIETSPGAFRLVLQGKNTGQANAFTIENALSNTSIAFTDTDHDGVSGEDDADNAVSATNASLLINNIPVSSTSNTVTSGIPGVTLTLRQKDPQQTVTVTVGRDDSALADRVSAFVSSYNDLVKFASDQTTAANNGNAGTLGRDSVLRSLRSQLRTALSALHASGAYTRLTDVGLGFNRTGQLTFDRGTFTDALDKDPAAAQGLFAAPTDGAFTAVGQIIDDYISAGGFVPDARTRLTSEASRLSRQVADMQARLAVRKSALQQEFIAADQAMSRLNSQAGSLSSFASSLTSHTP